MNIQDEIFRAYDIRGIVDKTLTLEAVYKIGQAFGSSVLRAGHNDKRVIVGRDGRLSGPRIEEALTNGIISTGCDVILIGPVPTPVLYFACKHLNAMSGIMITGSHNPPDYNGLKMILNGSAIYEEQIQDLKQLIKSDNLVSGKGKIEEKNVIDAYVSSVIARNQSHRSLKIVIDAGNGIAGALAPALFSKLGHSVIEMFCEVDGNFPNHHPDPGNPDNLKDLISRVKKENADIGLAFDGDGDRLGVVDDTGKIIWPDRLLMTFAKDILSSSPGKTIIYDIKSTNNLEQVIKDSGGTPLMWKTGHSLIKAKMKETDSALAGEMSGHIFIADNWFGFDDALFAGAKLLDIISETNNRASAIFAELPENVSTPEIPIDVTEDDKFKIIDEFKANASFPGARSLSTIDGLRVDFDDCWGLIRPSNTSPKLIARFEGKDKEALDNIMSKFKKLLNSSSFKINLPF